jgi:tetratricopeptide (TPR) repeat protein
MLLFNRKAFVKKNNFIFLFFLTGFYGYSQQVLLKTQTKSTSDLSVKRIYINSNQNTAKLSSIEPKANRSFENSNIESAEKVVIVSKLAPKGVDLNFLPLFGGFDKSESHQIEDQIFLSDCDKSFNSRTEASEFFAKMAWQYLEEGNKNNAINRFNLSYLLNNKNIDVFWGLGVIEYQSGNSSNAVKLLNDGLTLSKEPNHVLMVDLATIYLKMASENPNSLFEITKARELLEKALFIQPSYITAYMQLTLVEILENKIDLAWETFYKGYELNPKEINPEILNELLNRKEDPKGFFKK